MQRQKISWARSSCAAANRPVNPAANPIRLLIMCLRVEDDIPCGFKNDKALILSIQIIDSARVFHYEGRLHAISRDRIAATAASACWWSQKRGVPAKKERCSRQYFA